MSRPKRYGKLITGRRLLTIGIGIVKKPRADPKSKKMTTKILAVTGRTVFFPFSIAAIKTIYQFSTKKARRLLACSGLIYGRICHLGSGKLSFSDMIAHGSYGNSESLSGVSPVAMQPSQ